MLGKMPPRPVSVSNRKQKTAHTAFILKKAVTATNFFSAEELCQRGIDLLAAGSPAEAAEAFRAAIAVDSANIEAHHGLVRALRDAGRLEPSIAAALALTALTPNDPLAHTALSISLQTAGHVPQAEAAAARARVLEWKIQLQSPPAKDPQP
jgi:Flp pilus assembly protein TadD